MLTRQAPNLAQLQNIAKKDRLYLLNSAMLKIANQLNQQLISVVCIQEYEADKKRRLGEEGAKPKRIRYKPISR
jgi:hypothetical protein